MVVIFQLHRAYTSLTVTDYAVFIDYFCNVTVVGDFAVLSVGTQAQGQSDRSAKQSSGLAHISHAGLLNRKFRQISMKNSNRRTEKSPFFTAFLKDFVQQIETD